MVLTEAAPLAKCPLSQLCTVTIQTELLITAASSQVITVAFHGIDRGPPIYH